MCCTGHVTVCGIKSFPLASWSFSHQHLTMDFFGQLGDVKDLFRTELQNDNVVSRQEYHNILFIL